MGKHVKRSLRDTEIEDLVRALTRGSSAVKRRPLGRATRGVSGEAKVKDSSAVPDVVGLGWPTNLWK